VLDEKPPRDRGRCVAAVPSFRSAADQSMNRIERPVDLISFRGLVEEVVLDPPPTVTHHIPIAVGDSLGRGRIALEGKRRGEHGERQFPVTEEPV
jgi:hypothetical protein